MGEGLRTGSDVLDSLLPDGYPENAITMIYGPSASGKTTCCLLASLQIIAKGGKVIFVDTGRSFSPERLAQIAAYVPALEETAIENILASILLFQPKSFEEQLECVQKVERLCQGTDIGLVVIDTIGTHYRRDLKGNPKRTNMLMRKQLDILSALSKTETSVLFTNQVYESLTEEGVVAVGGDFIIRRSKCLVELAKDQAGRRAILRKHPSDDEMRIYPFEIASQGIVHEDNPFAGELY